MLIIIRCDFTIHRDLGNSPLDACFEFHKLN